MSRSAIAFVVAPLWFPLWVGLLFGIAAFPDSAQVQLMAFATVIAYAAMLTLGYPGFRYLRMRGKTSLWRLMGLGFVVGAVAWALIAFCLGFLKYGVVTMALHMSFNDVSLAPELLGIITAATFWLIARPDRASPFAARS